MYDLLALAYQADITRVITFMVAREVSNRTYPQVGVTDGHHAISHHQNRAEKMERTSRSRRITSALFGDFLERLTTTPDGDGSLLDHIAAALRQQHEQQQRAQPLPAAESGGRRRRAAGSRAAGTSNTEDHTPMTNLLLTMLDKVGVPQSRRSATAPGTISVS